MVLEKKLENNGHIHVYRPGAGPENAWGPRLGVKILYENKPRVTVAVCCKFSH